MNNTNLQPLIILQGFRLLIQPGIRAYILIPLLSNIIAFSAMIYGFYRLAAQSQFGLESWLPSWLGFLSYLIWPVMIVMALLWLFYGFSVLGNLIAAPFNAFLSEAVERHFGYPSANSPLTFYGIIKMISKSLLRELRKLFYSIKWWLLAFILSFFPVINLLSLAIAAWLLSIQYLDYPADNHSFSFAEALKRIKSNKLNHVSFGGSVLLCNALPIINFFTMPAAVCAATLLWHQNLHNSDTEASLR